MEKSIKMSEMSGMSEEKSLSIFDKSRLGVLLQYFKSKGIKSDDYFESLC